MPINDRVFISQAETIKQLAHESSCVIVGRCANYVLEDDDQINKLDLFIYADLESRIKRIKGEYNLTDAQAKDKIIKTEKKRRTFYNYYSSGNWGHATDYDLCINVSPLTVETTIEMVKLYIESMTK